MRCPGIPEVTCRDVVPELFIAPCFARFPRVGLSPLTFLVDPSDRFYLRVLLHRLFVDDSADGLHVC